jgi:hypothetical protein
MPPRKKKSRNDYHQEQAPFPFLLLPEAVLDLIAKLLLSDGSGHSMLAVSRATRDAVLRSLTRVKLCDLQDQRPAARLLDRACCEASPGLVVKLNLKDKNDALPVMLEAAFDSAARWHRVHNLRVRSPVYVPSQLGAQLSAVVGGRSSSASSRWLQVITTQTMDLNLLGLAMPCLRHLRVVLVAAGEGEGGLFAGLQACTGLEVLQLTGISIGPAAVKPCAAVLARLPALKDVSLQMSSTCTTDPSGFVQRLTCLTSLHLQSHKGSHMSSMCAAAACNPALQALTLWDDDTHSFSSDELQDLLTSCPLLTSLDMRNLDISHDELEVLLTYGTNITTLSVYAFRTDVSFADRQCSWKCLHTSQYYPTVLHWAVLPLKRVKELNNNCDLGTLHLPLPTVEPDQLATILRQATTNLAACPAWQADPASILALYAYPSDTPLETLVFTPAQRIQLLEALAPLGGPHISRLTARIMDAVFQWGRPELQALGLSLKSGQLSTLELDHCLLTADFWAALDEALPSLSSLFLCEDVECSAADVAGYCSKRKEGHPFTLNLSDAVYTAVGGTDLQAALIARGPAHVEVLYWGE